MGVVIPRFLVLTHYTLYIPATNLLEFVGSVGSVYLENDGL